MEEKKRRQAGRAQPPVAGCWRCWYWRAFGSGVFWNGGPIPRRGRASPSTRKPLTRREPFYQYDAPGVTAYAGVDVSAIRGTWTGPPSKPPERTSPCCGLASATAPGLLVEDNAFAQNAADAANAGLTVGVYFYSGRHGGGSRRGSPIRGGAAPGTNVSGPIAYDLNFTRRTRPGPTISPANRPQNAPRLLRRDPSGGL